MGFLASQDTESLSHWASQLHVGRGGEKKERRRKEGKEGEKGRKREKEGRKEEGMCTELYLILIKIKK